MSEQEILYQAKTEYNDIKVVREGSVITLYSPSNVRQSAIDTDNPESFCLEFLHNVFVGLALIPNPESILVMGLGGGVIPMILERINRRCNIDVVEIDPEMTKVAKQYFNFNKTSRMRLFIDDAFTFVKNARNNYDIIIMDVYIGSELPQECATPEFFLEARKCLSHDGIFISNLMTSDKLYYEKMLNTISSAFNEIWLLSGTVSGNTIVIATNAMVNKTKIINNAEILQDYIPENIQLLKLVDRLQKHQHYVRAFVDHTRRGQRPVIANINREKPKRPCSVCVEQTLGYCDMCLKPVCRDHYIKIPGYWADGKKYNRLLIRHPTVRNSVVVYCFSCEQEAIRTDHIDASRKWRRHRRVI